MIRPRPGDERGFLHKKILGSIGGFVGSAVSGGNPLIGAARGFVGGGKRRPNVRPPARDVQPRAETARPSVASEAGKLLGRTLKFAAGEAVATTATSVSPGDCIFPFRLDPRTGTCKIFLGERSGPDNGNGNGGALVGNAVMGRYGAGLAPGVMSIDRAVCLKGMRLGNDGLCYNKSQINNKQRMWPRGQRPLLTGGDMRAITIAARAGRRMEKTKIRLQGLGMMKTPKPRAPSKAKQVVVHADHHH